MKKTNEIKKAIVKATKTKYGDIAKIRAQHLLNTISNPERIGYRWTAEQIMSYCKTSCHHYGEGASKRYYHNNSDLIGISVDSFGAYINQIPAQIELWKKCENTIFSELLNPVLNYGLHRGNYFEYNAKRYREQCYIVAQHATNIGEYSYSDLLIYCGKKNGLSEYDARQEKERILTLAKEFEKQYHLRDLRNNSGNYGIIYDYVLNKYRVVFIDYGLDKDN